MAVELWDISSNGEFTPSKGISECCWAAPWLFALPWQSSMKSLCFKLNILIPALVSLSHGYVGSFLYLSVFSHLD